MPEWFTTYLFNAFLKANEHTDFEQIVALSKCRLALSETIEGRI